jgi:cytochrome b6-f complex iron-sulfur subunit
MEQQKALTSGQRRHFLLMLLGAVGTALAAMAGWPVLRYLAPQSSAGGNSKVEIQRDKLAIGGAYFFDYQGHPAVLLQPKPGHYVALTAVCTHLGCIVKWQNDTQEFLCPCHGGRFAADGAVLGGPPPSPLQTYPVTLNGDRVIIG